MGDAEGLAGEGDGNGLGDGKFFLTVSSIALGSITLFWVETSGICGALEVVIIKSMAGTTKAETPIIERINLDFLLIIYLIIAWSE